MFEERRSLQVSRQWHEYTLYHELDVLNFLWGDIDSQGADLEHIATNIKRERLEAGANYDH
jgi:hypothetical protein